MSPPRSDQNWKVGLMVSQENKETGTLVSSPSTLCPWIDPMPVFAKLHFPPGVGVSTTPVLTLRHLSLEQPQPQLVLSVTVGLILLEFCL